MRYRSAASAALLACAGAMALPAAHAHLMPDGHATINVQGGRVFVALSIPITWLGAVDDDGDAHLNSAELQTHRASILQTLDRGVKVRNGGATQALSDVLLSPSASHDRRDGAGTHVLVMGSAALANPSAPIGLDLHLQGPRNALTVTATRDPLREGQRLQGPVGSALFFAPWWERGWLRALALWGRLLA